MAHAHKLYVNPANTQQRYVLWTNGYIEPRGGALPVSQREANVNESMGNDAPTWNNAQNGPLDPARALTIIDWTKPSGYTLDKLGLIWPWGGASSMPGAVGVGTYNAATGGVGPDWVFGGGGGWSDIQNGFAVDMIMDPAGNGRGYMLDAAGRVWSLGTGATVIPSNWLFWDTWADSFVIDWSSKRVWILDGKGRVWGINGANNMSVSGFAPLTDLGFVLGEGRGLKAYDTSTANMAGWAGTRFGSAMWIGGAVQMPGGPYNSFYPQGIYEDLIIVNTTSPRLAILQNGGQIWEWALLTAPNARVQAPTGTITSNTRPFVRWTYSDVNSDAQKTYELAIINTATYSSGATSEVQRLTPSGTISGGTFTITFDGFVSAPIAFNASAATIQAALEAMANIGTGGVVCAGGPINTAFVSITFQNQMAFWNWPQVTIQSSLTGTTPLITPSTTTAGVNIDPAVASAVYRTSGTSSTLTSVQSGVDLPNTTYRAFVRVTDATGTVGIWRYSQWVQNWTALNVPTVTPNVVGGVGGIRLAVSAATGAGLPGTARFLVQYHDSDWDGTSWRTVRNGEALTPDGSGNATVTDYEARFGVVRSYRAVTYIYTAASNDFGASTFSGTVTATLGPRNIWVLSDPTASPNNDIEVKINGFKKEASVIGSVLYPNSRPDPVVLTDGTPKFPAFDLAIWALDNTTRIEIEQMIANARVLYVRDPFGNAYFFQPVERIQTEMLRASPLRGEVTPLRDANVITVPAQAVRRPFAGMTTGPMVDPD